MAVERVRGRVFGEVADEYDRVRPGYPSALIDDVLAYARLGGAPALEVGAGTGKATLAFAERGVTLTAVEPDAAMAAVLARRLADRPNATVEVCAFEDFVPPRPYGLLFSAQAWHWTDPSVRWQRAAAALAPGGALALFWNHDRPADPGVLDALVELHRHYLPESVPDLTVPDEASLATVWPQTDLVTLPDFADLTPRVYLSERVMPAADFVAFLSTVSACRMIDDDRRAEFFGAIVELVGSEVRLSVHTALFLARRQAR
jgi:SAM-dependent methyltransferase